MHIHVQQHMKQSFIQPTSMYLQALNPKPYCHLNSAVPILQLYSTEFTTSDCAFVPELVAALRFTN